MAYSNNILNHVNNINNNGYTIIKNGIDLDLIDKLVKDFDYWSSLEINNFTKFSFNRVVNFHLYNKNTLDLVTNTIVNDILKLFFNKEQAVYTSLFFREGTSQHYHRDTPHFYTNPIDQYVGVWYALEDINVNAGPLKYYIGSHKLHCPDGYETYNKLYNQEGMNNTYEEKNLKCLIEYNTQLENLCKINKLTCVDETNYINKINKGDIIIWHPKLVHGGSCIIDTSLTRYSMVTHNIPINTQVFNASHFFCNKPTNSYLDNYCKFDYIQHNNINIVNHYSSPKVQHSYL